MKSIDKKEAVRTSKEDKGIHKKIENTIMGRYKHIPRGKRPTSGISVQEPNLIEFTKAKKVLKKEHPLFDEDPQNWNNIPVCL